ncbi:MAG: hypothetical protein H3C31_12630 [Brumimicrobium sp.]|nr:hypothetical protein [Brumimicrobium sp.]MCO5268375.1 hypothetical protein [Brumimicrobium sp.]
MKTIVLSLLILIFNNLFTFSQDTLYLKNAPNKSDLNFKYLCADSMFTIMNGKVINLEYIEDSVLLDFNNEIYSKVKKFYFIINKSKIIDSCSYYFWIKYERDFIPFFVLGYLINESMNGIKFNLYTYKRRFFSLKKERIGFVVSLNYGYSSLTGKVKNVGDYSPECVHEWGRDPCELVGGLVSD